MLEPKKVKYRKQQKGRRRGTAHRGSSLAFGEYGLKAVARGWMSAREIEAARVALTRYLKRGGKVLRKCGLRSFNRAGYCSRWKALTDPLRERPSGWRRISFPFRPFLLRGKVSRMQAKELRDMTMDDLAEKRAELLEIIHRH